MKSEDKRAFVIGHPDLKNTQIPARDAKANGSIIRSNFYPNCSYMTNWVNIEDTITWDAEVAEDGNFEVIDKNDHLFNRIHRDDISNIIMKAMEKPSKNRILNLADGNPSSKLEVVKYTAKLIGAKPPIPIPFSKNKLSQSQRPYYLSSKKVHSNIKKILGIDLIFPSYREGIKSIVNDQS